MRRSLLEVMLPTTSPTARLSGSLLHCHLSMARSKIIKNLHIYEKREEFTDMV